MQSSEKLGLGSVVEVVYRPIVPITLLAQTGDADGLAVGGILVCCCSYTLLSEC